MSGAVETLHATVITLGRRAAMIRGASGSGKSDLAMRCLATGTSVLFPEPARLVADDYVELSRRGDSLVARCPEPIRGKIEVRGIGIFTLPYIEEAELAVVFDIHSDGLVERHPIPLPQAAFLGVSVPCLALRAFEASAAAKVLMFLQHGPT